MTKHLSDEECNKLKCDTCGRRLCKEAGDGYEIEGHFITGQERIRCVVCYEKNNGPLES
jgi:hypothetical protein